MDYEKKYKEALERAKKELNTCGSQDCDAARQIIRLFPELEESEDERMSRELIAYFRNNSVSVKRAGLDVKKVIEWLEKQVPVDEDEIVEGIRRGVAISLINHIDANSKGMCLSNMECENIKNAIVNEDWDKVYGYMKKNLKKQGKQKYTQRDVDDAYLKGLCDAKQEFEKQDEQKPVDKVKPTKFNVGDWVVNKGHSYLIADIDFLDNRYLFEIGGYTHEQLNWEYIENVDKNYHLWSIKDAKEGDVLEFEDHGRVVVGVVSFVSEKTGKVDVSCLLEDNNFKIGNFYALDTINPHPATKEQRETLFKAMHEAGYEWSSEHRKLIKNDACVALTKKMLYDIILDLKVFRDKDCSAEGKAAYQREIDWLENLKKELEE